MKTNGEEPINSPSYIVAYKIKNGHYDKYNQYTNLIGLTKREYFAAMSLQGLCASKEGIGHTHEVRAAWAANQADALIKALNETKP